MSRPGGFVMKKAIVLAWIFCLVLASGQAVAAGPEKATVREYRKTIRTYPFSDPNPIAAVGRIYPYFRFDGYTNTAVDREWTVVELENRYLRVTVLPEIGGKIWSAVEKSTGRSFIYENHVVKFRDIAMRGPWTSGGIEANYGIIGHTPNCATPVDYRAWTDADGSAVVVIGVLDLLTRTPWRLRITLPPDSAYFTTESFWFNATPIEQPYYSWMNTGIKAAGGLELVYPGTHYIGHGGELFPWPLHPANGRNLAFYAQNDFGPYKSYHVLGRHSDFFGAYWHDDDFGVGRYSTRDDKLGKKAWIWGLSRQGMIWEKLLTDSDGQYVEVQSGRLFNQAAEASTLTPFKHRGFAPRQADRWTEYWFPVKATKGFVMANQYAALNVLVPPDGAGPIEVRLSPLQRLTGTLEVLDGDRPVFTAPLDLQPMQAWSQTIPAGIPAARLGVRIGRLLEYRVQAGDELSRPLEAPPGFDWQSVQGLWLRGKEWMRQREYAQAQTALEACLKQDPNYLPALADLAVLRYRAMDYKGAWDLARRGLSIDTYDPASNYYYGLASARLGRVADALDGFEVAASDPGFRSAAWTELARQHLAAGRADLAAQYADRCRQADPSNIEAGRIVALTARLAGNRDAATRALDALAALDPLEPFAAFERHLLAGDAASRRTFVEGIRNEMPHETFLELAAWYRNVGRVDEARRVLELAPSQAEVLYWRAFLQAEARDPAAAATLRLADAASPRLVFPFRAESADVFEWAVRESASWHAKYFLALIAWSRDDIERARRLLRECGEAPDFAPFYAARWKAFDPVARAEALSDLVHAAALEPGEWRYGKLLAERYLEDRAADKALEVAARYYKQSPGNYILGMLEAKCLLRVGRVEEAALRLGRLDVLPYEGSTDGRALYREAQLLLGAKAWKGGHTDEALRRVSAAREWPENLGAGKPYPEDADERLEDWLEALCLDKLGRSADAQRLRDRVAARTQPSGGAAWPAGASPDESRLLSAWQS
jgi:tetratricopeptide (TPR) repeat protein